MSRNKLISLESEALERIPRSYQSFLEKFIRRDGDGHFPRFGGDEIGQRENHAIDDADDQADDRQKAEQAGHLSALKHRINHGMIHHVRLGVARGSGKRVGGGSIGDKEPGQRKCGQSRPSSHLAEKMSDTASSAPSSASPETEILSA